MPTTRVNMDVMPLRKGHFWVLFVAALGQMVGAALSTLVGIILPLIQIHLHPELTSFEQGLVCCTSLIGIMIGSILFGKLSDLYGYLMFFRICPTIIFIASLLVFFTDDIAGLVIGLFFMGLGAGGEYSLDGDYISEIMPNKWKLFMVGMAKAICSLGNIMMALLCFVFIKMDFSSYIWNKLVLIITGIAFLMICLRTYFAQSPGWLIANNRLQDAERSVRFFLGDDVDLGDIANKPQTHGKSKQSWGSLFTKENIPKIVFSGLPWSCSGVGSYGIGIFIPILIMAIGLETNDMMPIERVIDSVKNTTFISIFILIGFLVGLYWVDRINHVKMQGWGFILSGIGLILLLVSYCLHWPLWLSIMGFMIFEFFLNAGPNLVTYIIPPQIYSVEDRGTGAGLAAACGKVGAILSVFMMPLLLLWGGAKLALIISIIAMFLGALITFVVGRKVLPSNKKRSE